MPALNNLSSSNAMWDARRSFIEMKNSDKRIYSSITAKFVPGDEVYWKREGENFRGPSTIVGQMNSQVFTWNFRRVVKINPIRVKLVLKDDVTDQMNGIIATTEPVLSTE